MTETSSNARTLAVRVDGMSCGGCAARVQDVLRGMPGVREAVVNLATHTAVVTAGVQVPFEDIANTLKRQGYDATLVPDTSGAAREREQLERLRHCRMAMVQGILMYALPVLLLEWLGPTLSSRQQGHDVWWRALQAVLCTMAFLSPAGGPILYGGLRALLFWTPNMDLLLTVGVVVAYSSSVVAIVWPGEGLPFHFHAVVMILAFINVGRYLEARAHGRVGQAVGALAEDMPRVALRAVEEVLEEVPVASLAPGDHVRAVAEQIIAVDGRVIEGRAEVDESLLSGDALPVVRGPGDRIAGGTRVVSGFLTIEVTAAGEDSARQRIESAVRRAQAAHTRLQQLADRVAGVFVTVVVVLAACAWLVWGFALGKWAAGGSAAVAMLVIACPCALGLATPTAVFITTTRAALRGILVRDPAAFERLGRAGSLIFDKTGTLTLGRPDVVEVIQAEPGRSLDLDTVWAAAAGLEQHVVHPLARAIVHHARELDCRPAPIDDVESVIGGGVRGAVEGRTMVIGSRHFLESSGVDCASRPDAVPTVAWSGSPMTVVGVAWDGAVVLWLVVADRLRPDALRTLERLHDRGMHLALVTGDSTPLADSERNALRLDDVRTGVSPQGKVDYVRARNDSGEWPAFVGDGTNDAAALSESICGIALATGTDLANQASAVCVVSDRLERVADAVDLSRRMRRVIQQNLVWAFGYNILALPLAAAGVVPAWLAPAAMMCSSLGVVLNALRLGGWEPEGADQ